MIFGPPGVAKHGRTSSNNICSLVKLHCIGILRNSYLHPGIKQCVWESIWNMGKCRRDFDLSWWLSLGWRTSLGHLTNNRLGPTETRSVECRQRRMLVLRTRSLLPLSKSLLNHLSSFTYSVRPFAPGKVRKQLLVLWDTKPPVNVIVTNTKPPFNGAWVRKLWMF